MFDFIISLVVLAALALAAGAFALYRRGDRKRARLMALLVAVMVVNVAIWMVPTEGGDTLAESAAAE